MYLGNGSCCNGMDPAVQEQISRTMETFSADMGHIDGVQLPQRTCDNWDLIHNFQARDDDILIVTYPKAGTTWMQEVVDMVMHEADVEKCMQAPCFVRVPFIELVPPAPMLSGMDQAITMDSPRVLKTHLPLKLLPPSIWEKNSKVIYVARNAKDCLVSYFHFHRMNKGLPDPGSWESFVSAFLTGDVAWGSWFDHVIDWWKAKDRHQILYVFYEDMIEDLKREIRKVMKFLGKDLSEEVLEKIHRHTTFQAMKENPMANYSSIPSAVFNQSISPFMRKGTVGDWKNHFLVAQNDEFEEEYKRKMEGSGLNFRTQLSENRIVGHF
ncbi:sulfotransferase 1C1-like isoform X1 [Ascaphus truei]|uniref:sulfotransferase 1C1-like isoform X1 n=1 Tax=Ascaphus truei TaxID=8439 RepID=UPI003F596DB8